MKIWEGLNNIHVYYDDTPETIVFKSHHDNHITNRIVITSNIVQNHIIYLIFLKYNIKVVFGHIHCYLLCTRMYLLVYILIYNIGFRSHQPV